MRLNKIFSKFTKIREVIPNEVIVFDNWKIEINAPFGFVVRNLTAKESYHFCARSNGWITGEWQINRSEEEAICTAFNSRGFILMSPVLVDSKATEKYVRIEELKLKPVLMESEKEELLKLSGLRK